MAREMRKGLNLLSLLLCLLSLALLLGVRPSPVVFRK